MTQIYIKFGKKDEDLKRWRIALKKTGYPLSVAITGIILSKLQSTVFWLPPVVAGEDIDVPDTVSSKITVNSPEVEEYLKEIKENQISSEIKKLIREYLCTDTSSVAAPSPSRKRKYKSSKNIAKAVEEEKQPQITKKPEAPSLSSSSFTTISDDEDESDFDFSKLLSLAGEE